MQKTPLFEELGTEVDMLDLSRQAGFPLWIDSDNRLHFADRMHVREIVDRPQSLLAAVRRDSGAIGNAPDPAYTMYRDLRLDEAMLFTTRQVRFDITVLYPGLFGEEHAKTAGHVHPLIPGAQVTYSEVYYVIHGQALWMLYTLGDDGIVGNAVCVAAQAGTSLIIPSHQYHITINPGTEVLVMANIVSSRFQPHYEPVERYKGGAYYVLGPPEQPAIYLPNPHYRRIPALQHREAGLNPEIGLRDGVSLYQAFIIEPHLYDFLNNGTYNFALLR